MIGLPDHCCLGHEGLNVSGGGCDAEQSAPDAKAGQRVVDLGLGEQALGFGDFVDGAEARLDSAPSPAASRCARRIPGRACWRRCGARRSASRRRDSTGPAGRSRSAADLACLRANRGGLRGFARANRRQVEHRESHGEAERVVLNVGRETVEPAQDSAVDLRAGAARIGGALQIEARESRSAPGSELRLGLLRPRRSAPRDRIRRGIERRDVLFGRQSAASPRRSRRSGPAPRRRTARAWRAPHRRPAAPESTGCARPPVRLRRAKRRRRAATARSPAP